MAVAPLKRAPVRRPVAAAMRWRSSRPRWRLCCWQPSVAHAQFTVCNQTFDVVNLAVGQEVDKAFQTEGWWTVGANQCADVIRDELVDRYIYVYAEDVFGQPVLNGATEMCIGEKRFVIRGIDSCWQRGYRAAKFYEVDTQAVERWTFFLTTRQSLTGTVPRLRRCRTAGTKSGFWRRLAASGSFGLHCATTLTHLC